MCVCTMQTKKLWFWTNSKTTDFCPPPNTRSWIRTCLIRFRETDWPPHLFVALNVNDGTPQGPVLSPLLHTIKNIDIVNSLLKLAFKKQGPKYHYIWLDIGFFGSYILRSKFKSSWKLVRVQWRRSIISLKWMEITIKKQGPKYHQIWCDLGFLAVFYFELFYFLPSSLLKIPP